MRKIAFFCLLVVQTLWGQTRQEIDLNAHWQSVVTEDSLTYPDFHRRTFETKRWQTVQVPHNWDQYGGYRRNVNGNRFGTGWYRKSFRLKQSPAGKRFFLFFEGVGSYATVWLNGTKVGDHAGGRTTFTLDVTSVIYTDNRPNLLAVRADHPDRIQDLPWVSGGSSSERGFSEGSQPLGIFRPVQLVVTNDVRIEPFGIHVWNDATVSTESARLHVSNELRNYSSKNRTLAVINQLKEPSGRIVSEKKVTQTLTARQLLTLKQELPLLKKPYLWSPESPYLYQLHTQIFENGQLIDEQKTAYGIRKVEWDLSEKAPHRLKINDKPVFINGVAEYEHLLGGSHAFTVEQIRTRVNQVKSAGFNAFRDAHQPHNLRYHPYWDKSGILWWPQMAAHIWYDTPAFRSNFKKLLVDWVKERRNSPSIILWGLENESTLPEDFARECSDLIRELDPTASSQRKITTCNGGKGTDWDVPQNWTGTYGGDPLAYGEDLKRQILVGEYGAWRTIDEHTERPGVFTENRMTDLMETKIRLAESVKDQTAGHFFWLLNSHDNPGRVQGGEGLRELDRIGPVNYKGLFTAWEEPTDAYYLFRSNYAPKETQPMVYLVSHTWPDRWLKPGKRDSIMVYSNCDEVELFNDVNQISLGKRTRQGVGTHFQWDDVPIQYNVLYAVGYVKGKAVARDVIVLNHLPKAPHLNELYGMVPKTESKGSYLYRVNCGGPGYVDARQNVWLADQHKTKDNTWGSNSWTDEFPGMPSFFASQRRTFDPIRGTADQKLYRTFRYGRDKLSYTFQVPDGDYFVELFFIEPWYGTGGGLDCTGWRLFDVAINDEVKIKNLDIWKEVGHDALLKKVIPVTVRGGILTISFPKVTSAQAIISAIAIGKSGKAEVFTSEAPSFKSWLDTGDELYADSKTQISSLPSTLYGACWLQRKRADRTDIELPLSQTSDVYVAGNFPKPEGFDDTRTVMQTGEPATYAVYRKRVEAGTKVLIPQADFVAWQTASSMEPAYDLKAITSYKATQAGVTGAGLAKESLMDKERIVIKENNKGTLDWKFSVGVADTYSMTLKYHNPTSKPLKVQLELILSDGTVIKPAEVQTLDPSKPGKWTYFATSTGTMINAGTYTLRLKSIDAVGLYLDAMDVQ